MNYNSIYFDSGGFYMFCILAGSLQEIHSEYHRAGSRIGREPKLYGNSAGAACALICYLVLHDLAPISLVDELMFGLIDRQRPFSLSLTPIMCELIDEGIKYWPADLHQRVSGILHIGITTQTGHRYISKFKTNADIYHALLCSMTVVGFSTYDTIYKNRVCIDGWYTFAYTGIREDCLVLTDDLYFPWVLTVPPKIIRKYLMAYGNAMVSDRCNGRTTDRGLIRDEWRVKDPKVADMMLKIHSIWYKDPQWKRHIETKTKSRISTHSPT
jgi:hypothetical protein